MEEEIKASFKMAYLPLALKNQRYNGGDFLSVAIPLMDYFRSKGLNDVMLKKAARIIVLEFNNLLNPKMSADDIDNFINSIYNPGPLTRAMAARLAQQNS